ncbi:hypothetical protein TSUD_60700 [Trifolium subterraneum]|uniref:Replication protein A 70 kDa DNA-binding subunit B/D first OB fold domain-containing protein n=1 Tax=Trifolium subterraneum TaxID=3900 RepID=A0A2Z6P8M8_TRISU|nr:hypothetical protein TSUD_60700 [Trifolium subterraneum]
MANHIDMISTINDVPRNWRLIVKVVRLWGVPEFNTPNQFRSLELVLMDSEGTRIHCSVKKTLIYLFQKQLSEGVVYTLTTFDVVRSTGEYRPTSHVYKLDATYNTKFTRSGSIVFPEIVYTFTPPADVLKNDFNRDFLIGAAISIYTDHETKESNGDFEEWCHGDEGAFSEMKEGTRW